jgi:energy-coupling factor transporter ATP-binding protein EcfA2
MGLDFMEVSTKTVKKSKDLYITEVYPDFLVGRSKDLMIRGGDLYAVWDEEQNIWLTDENDILPLIDWEIKKVADELKSKGEEVQPLYLRNEKNKMIYRWHSFCQKALKDNFHQLDNKIIFDDKKMTREDYATKCLPYHLTDEPTPAYNELTSVLYSPEELAKIEWCIGAIFTGDSRYIQKFLVITGEPGSGKSTILKIMEMLFEGYYIPLDTKAITSGASFALEQFQSNPLVAIEHDGNLSRVYDNSKLNSMISHEEMRINAKFKDSYGARFDTFLIMASNLPVEITDAKSGLTRRIIDAEPSGNKVSKKQYDKLMRLIKFELGGIAKHCIELYSSDKTKYDGYKPERQIAKTYRFYDFIDYVFNDFAEADYITLDYAWSKYRKYIELSGIKYPFDRLRFKTELEEFFEEFYPRKRMPDGVQARSVYVGFIKDKLMTKNEIKQDTDIPEWLKLDAYSYSVLDKELKECPAQYAKSDGTPMKFWDDVNTTLSDISPGEIHYVRPPENLIVIDFDIRDDSGNKSLKENIKAASSFPPTYTEISKGGQGLHLHYIWDGDVNTLSSIYDVNVEIKVFKGKSALRRRLTECNDLPIATISTGLPTKEVVKKDLLNKDSIKSERGLRKLIIRNLHKEIHDSTKPSIDFIWKILEDAYNSGLHYDISDMYPAIEAFAMKSTNQAEYCIKKVSQMKFKSDEPSDDVDGYGDKPIIFFDVEVFPNVLIVCHKMKGEGQVIKMINPSSDELKKLIDYRLVGFNNRRYDNHILYAAAYSGYNNEQLFKLSQRIIAQSQNAFFGEAYNLAYADVYEYSSKKQSLKKWEIELGIFHLENSYPWDEPLAEEHWQEVADYCANDVIATEKVAEACHQDFVAREILAKLSGLTVNNTTRQHATKIIFGNDKNPNLVYTDLSKEFPGYTFENGHSLYLGEDPSEGGYVYAEPGIHYDVALLDVASLHPHSIIELNLFGDYTPRFKDILDARIAIKHHDFDTARNMLDGALTDFLEGDEAADNLAQALKIVINSVYGYTTATFENPFKDPRNVDNIVAKRGALFMMTLKREVQNLGYTVAHIKTDSIKIPNADEKIISFCMEFAKKYGYTFEHEATYEKMCLVNDAVYVAKYKDGKHAGEWSATGTQFQVPYVFKTLFSKEPIIFDDMCETKSVTSALYLDFNEKLGEDEHDYRFVGRVGQFTPIKPGCGGALLLREKDGKYNAATGSKGYRWMESKMVKECGLENCIDISYYAKLVDAARAAIEEYGDVEEFIK